MKFNLLEPTDPTQTVNYEGEISYVLSAEMELYTAVVCTLLNASNFETAEKRIERIRGLMAKVSPVFVAGLAVYVREQMYLRSVPVMLAGELAKIHNGDDLVGKTVGRVVQRPDEIMELLAYYQFINHRQDVKKLNRLSKQMQKGLSTAFNRFDEYQFAKYNNAHASIKLRDALFLVHPKAKNETQQAIFNKIATDSLAIPYTWETELSRLGQADFASPKEKALAFRAKWEKMIASQRLGYMATLRNLRNILKVNVSPGSIEQLCAQLSDEKAVQKSKQLPFRFLSAYREIKGIKSKSVPLILDALEDAIRHSVTRLAGFGAETRVVVACDVSGSMQIPVSPNSNVQLFDIGLLLGMLLQSKCRQVVSGIFGDRWKIVDLPAQGILANVEELYHRSGEVGYSTNGYLVLDDLIKRRYVADKVLFFTDMQMWNNGGNRRGHSAVQYTIASKWAIYKQIAPDAKLYLFDLAGLGQSPLRTESNDVFLIAGWSDKIFDVLQALETGEHALCRINEIEL